MRNLSRRYLDRLVIPSTSIASLGWIFSGVLILVLAVVCYFAAQSLRDAKSLNVAWQQLDHESTERLKVLQQLQEAIGYGGFIHHFKNYILRSEAAYFDKAFSALRQADANIEDYHVLSASPQENEALNEISTILEAYQSALLKAKRFVAEGNNPVEVDNKVRINDTAAINALKTLEKDIRANRNSHDRKITERFETFANNLFFRTATITSLLATATLGLLFLVQLRLCKPLTNIVHAIKKFSQGNYAASLPERHRKDEIGEIARILDVWRQSARGKAQLHRELEMSMATVDLMNEIAVAANQADNKRDAFGKCLALVCRFSGWEVGHMWKTAKDGTKFIYPVDCWYFSDEKRFAGFREETELSLYHFGEGVPGKVCETGNVFWHQCAKSDEEFPRKEIASLHDLSSCVGVPVKVQNEVVAVLEFFSTQPIEQTPELVEILTHIGTQMGRVAERIMWAQEAIDHADNLQERVDAATEELRRKAEELRRSLEKEQELNTLQRQFVSMASHEFRTPLAIIDSSAQKLQRQKNNVSSDDLAIRTGKIRTAVERMTSLMESTLSAARLESGALDVSISTCDARSLIEKVCEHQQELTHTHFITLDLEAIPETIQADSGAIEQIFTNLLSNAVKYSPEAPEINISAWTKDDEVHFAVSDKGLGIDKEELPKMFTRFFRATTSTGIAGTGIGLNLVKLLVEAHGGSIRVESTKGTGSTFTVSLPINGPYGHTFEIEEVELRESA